jgi:CHRD domain
MPRMSRVLVMCVAAGVLAAVSAVGGEQAARTFAARLSTVPIDLPMAATIAGLGSARAELKGHTLAITGEYKGLHRGPKGIRGPAFADLKASGGTEGTISGTIELTQQQIDDLGRSWFYIQLHSEKAPDGNLWGWLLPSK